MGEHALIDPLRRFVACCRTCTAPRPGSNHLSVLALYSVDEAISVDGEEMEAMYRAGLLAAVPVAAGVVVEDTDEYGGIDADYLWSLSLAGLTAIQETGHDR